MIFFFNTWSFQIWKSRGFREKLKNVFYIIDAGMARDECGIWLTINLDDARISHVAVYRDFVLYRAILTFHNDFKKGWSITLPQQMFRCKRTWLLLTFQSSLQEMFIWFLAVVTKKKAICLSCFLREALENHLWYSEDRIMELVLDHRNVVCFLGVELLQL